MVKKLVIGCLTLALIPLAVELAKFWAEKEEPILQHVIGESYPKEINGKYLSMYAVSLYNVGNKMAEDVRLSFRVPQGNIDKVAVTQTLAAKPAVVSYSGNTAAVELSKLNSKQILTAQLLVSGSVQLPKKLEVYAQGNNVTSTEQIAAQPIAAPASIPPYLVSLLVVSIGMPVLFFVMDLIGDLENRYKVETKKMKIDVKIDGEKVLVRVLEGRGASPDYVTVVGRLGEHVPTKLRGYDFIEMGSGEHTIYRK